MGSNYRTDVQGVRSIGMALVVLFHIWFGKVSGGVDVFFVVSAYLMTSSLISTANKTGSVDFLKFWGRIALRIIPTAFFVLFCTLVIGAFVMPKTLWDAFGLHALASAIQLENIKLMREATNYLDRGTPASPFQQFWALSTQIQFFFVLPFLVFVPTVLSKLAFKKNYQSWLLLPVVAILGVASFAYAIYILRLNPAPHYFDPLTRFWEFMAGSACAIVAPKVRIGLGVRRILGWIALFMIVSCGIVIPVTAPFPGVAALLPVGGAALLLLCGDSQNHPGTASKLLSAPILQQAAKISFTTYLWHWPILVFAQELTSHAHLNLWQGLIVIVLSIAAAMATRKFVELPFQNIPKARVLENANVWVAKSVPFVVTGALLVPIIVFIVGWNAHFSAASTAYISSATAPAPLGLIRGGSDDLPADINRQLVASKQYLPALYSKGCNPTGTSSAVIVCESGSDKPDAVRVVLLGGSHSAQWYPALEAIAERRNIRLINITKTGCALTGEYIGPHLEGARAKVCADWAAAAVSRSQALKPDIVFTTATRPGPGNVGDEVPDAFKSLWQDFNSRGIAVLAVRDNPRAETFFIPLCLDRNRSAPSKCDMSRSRHLSDPSPLRTVQDTRLLSLIDLSDHICSPQTCPAIVKGVMIYNDNSHLSVPFVLSLSDIVEQKLDQLIARVGAPDTPS